MAVLTTGALARTSGFTALPRAFALVAGVFGVVAAAVLLAFFTLASPYDASADGPEWLGPLNDVLGVVQFAAFAPVAWLLRRRLPATLVVRIATWVGTAALVALSVLGSLLVGGALTFAAQIGPVIAAITCTFGWLLAVSLAAHRHRSLPRGVSRFGTLIGSGYLLAIALVGSSLVTPGVPGRIGWYAGLALGGGCWVALCTYPLLLAATVFRPDAPVDPAPARRPIRRSGRALVVLTWVYAACFGLPTLFVVPYLLSNGRLPSFLGLFDMYGGPWSATLGADALTLRLIAFAVLTLFAAWFAWLAAAGSTRGTVGAAVVLSLEVVCWVGFALPFPWLIGAARVVLLIGIARRPEPTATTEPASS